MKNNLLVSIAFFLLLQLPCFGQEDIIWRSPIKTSIDGNTLTRTDGNGWNGGAASTQKMKEGENGYVETTVKETTTYRMIGLSSVDLDAGYKTIHYAIYTAKGGVIYIFESGVNKGRFGNYTTGDTFTIEREGSTITYKKNGDVFYTSLTASNGSLLVDATIYSLNGTLANVKVNFGTQSNSVSGDVKEGEWGKVFRMTADKYAIGGDSLKCPGDFRLYVENGILSKRVKVAVENSENWADYVFEDNYKRKSISETANFINNNKHLPNVPSANEVIKNGIDLQQMDATLLRQVEELWLHLIDMDKKLNQLETENKNLKVLLLKQKIKPQELNEIIPLLLKKR